MQGKNNSTLSHQLESMGFGSDVSLQLAAQICFAPIQFDLTHAIPIGEDMAFFTVRIERGLEDHYQLKHYTATLRKQVLVPDELVILDQQMRVVNWQGIAAARHAFVSIAADEIDKASAVIKALEKMGSISDILRYKYWMGTPLESMIQFVSQHKSNWEISERFYFFDQLELIRFKDAILFLNSRWMERQLSVRKKLAERSLEAEGGESGRGLIMKKRVRNSSKKNLLKK